VTGIVGSGTGSVTFSGTIAQINALLNGGAGTVLYNDSTPSNSSTQLTLTIKDSGGLSDTATATIDLAPGGNGSQDWGHDINIFGTTQGTPTQWTVPNYDGLTSTVFNGGGITYDTASHLPTNGGIGSINLVEGSSVLETITGVAVSPGSRPTTTGRAASPRPTFDSQIPMAPSPILSEPDSRRQGHRSSTVR
jgi:hypothetical protein